jgi:hypothetical protein
MSIGYKLGRAVRAIWNGPFYIGKLTQPVSVGDVLLKTLETFWRTIIAIIAIFFAVAAVVSAWIYIINPIFFPAAKSYIKISAEFDDGKKVIPPTVSIAIGSIASKVEKPFRCNADYPIKVTIGNTSNRRIGEVRFSLSGYTSGFSTDYVIGGDYFEASKIIEPDMGWISCYSIGFKDGVDPAILHFDAKTLSAEYTVK